MRYVLTLAAILSLFTSQAFAAASLVPAFSTFSSAGGKVNAGKQGTNTMQVIGATFSKPGGKPTMTISPTGEIYAAFYSTLALADAAATSAGAQLVISTVYTTVPATLSAPAVKILPGGQLNGSSTVAITGQFEECDGCFGVNQAVTGLRVSRPEWWTVNATPGTTNMASAIRAALASSNLVEFSATIYRINSAVPIPANKTLRANGATIIVGWDDDGFTVANGRTSGIAATITTAHTNDTLNATTMTTVAVADASAYSVGDLVIMVGTNNQNFAAHIHSISGTTITLDDYLIYTVTAPTLYKLTPQNVVIDGFKMYHAVASPSASSYLMEIAGSSVTVKNCVFGDKTYVNSQCVTAQGPFVEIYDNTFDSVDLAVQAYNANLVTIRNNTITNFDAAIRVIYSDRCSIVENKVHNGRNMPYGIGIDIVATGGYDKNCRNLVQGNSVIKANKGTVGSGIGGIHLNFAAKYNRIIGNTSVQNTFGIYLENNADNNTISGNICSDNDGYYGVGIELDWDSSNNTITGNVCDNNRGSLQSAEAAGIQIRDFGTNPNLYNTISGNTCRGNGLDGIRVGGKYTTVTGNTVEGNGVDIVAFNAADATLLGWGIRVVGPNASIVGNTVYQNAYDTRATSAFTQVGIGVMAAASTIITNNTVYAGYYAENAIRISSTSDDVMVANNNILSVTATGQAVYATTATDVYVNSNFIYQSDNGQPVISFTNTDKYSIWGNRFTGALSTLSLTGSTNRYTPADN